MELWIRSQDKRTLINTRRIDVDDNNIIVWDEGRYASEIYLGQYKTKERALEVLDEIQNILEPLLIIKNCTNKEEKQKASEMCNISDFIGTSNNCDIHLLSNTYVYQMPDE